jgi:ABC-type phosphate/phosphonate transport system permease subunit
MWDFLRRMVPPDLSVLGNALRGAVETIQIAVVGTAVAAVLALPLGFAAARNAAPPWLFYWARSLLNAFRAVDTLVYALFFVAAVGLGPFPGVLAVMVYTATVLAKLYSEAIEAIEPGPVEAVRATGARHCRSYAGACCRSSCRSSCPSRCTASRRISGRRRSWASWGRGASASTSRRTCGC